MYKLSVVAYGWLFCAVCLVVCGVVCCCLLACFAVVCCCVSFGCWVCCCLLLGVIRLLSSLVYCCLLFGWFLVCVRLIVDVRFGLLLFVVCCWLFVVCCLLFDCLLLWVVAGRRLPCVAVLCLFVVVAERRCSLCV